MIPVPADLQSAVSLSLQEDVQSGDVSAQLIPAEQQSKARIICREATTICGTPYADEVFKQVDPSITVVWHVQDGEKVDADSLLCELEGNSRSLLTAERCALNFIQTLSGTASTVARYVAEVEGTQVKLLDTRKTIPGLRLAQKYAVACGGGHNHRIGLFDAFLIKENHIAAAGSITAAIQAARDLAPDLLCEIEVENFNELAEANAAQPDRIMLDNFSCTDMQKAVQEKPAGMQYEASGGITIANLKAVAATGVDYISLGCLTKDLQSVDLSMRFID